MEWVELPPGGGEVVSIENSYACEEQTRGWWTIGSMRTAGSSFKNRRISRCLNTEGENKRDKEAEVTGREINIHGRPS